MPPQSPVSRLSTADQDPQSRAHQPQSRSAIISAHQRSALRDSLRALRLISPDQKSRLRRPPDLSIIDRRQGSRGEGREPNGGARKAESGEPEGNLPSPLCSLKTGLPSPPVAERGGLKRGESAQQSALMVSKGRRGDCLEHLPHSPHNLRGYSSKLLDDDRLGERVYLVHPDRTGTI